MAKKPAPGTTKILISYDEFQTADDGNTTHYGGVVKVGHVRVQASGTDRDFGCILDIKKGIEQVLGRKLTTAEDNTLDESDCFTQLGEDVELTFENGTVEITDMFPTGANSSKPRYRVTFVFEANDQLEIDQICDTIVEQFEPITQTTPELVKD
jgi:hypothetical protein